MLHANPLPFRQGELDGLCGIYSVINAVRLVLGPRSHLLKPSQWQDLFVALLESVDRTMGAAQAASNGIETRALRYLLRAACLHLATEHHLPLRAAPLLSQADRPTFVELLPRISGTVNQPGQAIVLSVFGALDHWTVVQRVSRSWMVLFDSSGHHRIAVKNCRMIYERPLLGARQHVVPPDAVFRVSCAPMSPRSA